MPRNPFSRKHPTIPYHDEPPQDESATTLLPKAASPEDDTNPTTPHSSKYRTRCNYLVVSVVSLMTGLLAGHFLQLNWNSDDLMSPYASPHHNIPNVIWSENRTFSGSPTPESDDAWIDLIPLGMGFIQHPVLTPDGAPKGVSVFHEVHCLHGLHTSFFTTHHLLSYLSSQRPSDPSDPYPSHLFPATPHTPDPHLDHLLLSNRTFDLTHIKHCFDYLRQALLCAADTNLEDVMFTTDGRHGNAEGWGSRRVCRDYEGVKRWAEQWRVTGGRGIGGN